MTLRSSNWRRPQDGEPEVSKDATDLVWWRRPTALLALVAAVHAVLPILILGRHWFIGIDESVYLSQINAHVPPGGFSAPRARGSTLLAVPITAFTDAVGPMRLWAGALSGVGLFLAFRTWLRLRPGYLVPLAAALFASIWVVTYYGFQVMPNEWGAFATVGACGSLLNFLLDGSRWSLTGAAVALGLTALFRPSDAVFALAALAVVCVLCRTSWTRRVVAVGALTIGAVAGATQWIIEARSSFHGVRARLHVAEAEQGGAGLHWTGPAEVRTLGGPVLCRTTCHAKPEALYWLWWLAGALLIVVAVSQLRRMARPIVIVAPLVLGLVMAAQYVFTVPYAAPRFLLPAYAALAIPCAAGAVALVRGVRPRRGRVALAGLLAAAFVGHEIIQVHVITARIAPPSEVSARLIDASAAALRADGITGRCLILGDTGTNGPLAYRLRCSNRRPTRTELLSDLHRGVRVAWLRSAPPSRGWGIRWRKEHVHYLVPTNVYLSTARSRATASP